MKTITDKKTINQIENALSKIRPFLQSDGGDIDFVELSRNEFYPFKLWF